MELASIQSSLRELQLPAWLLYEFHGSNPIARHVAGLSPDRFSTRRWFGLIPQTGDPTWLHHAIEARKLPVISAESEYVPQSTVQLPEDQAKEVLDLVDALEQDEDDQRVFHNLA